ncbi:hypothetical protein CRUP_015968 [Coryphaenoides rupestris]|nr:hypothetical protein CRUP_015968 [Coryphaenoides rupestris]
MSVTDHSGLSPAPFTQDCLILEKNEMLHPICSFQDDFQEFEMIDDEDEEEEDDDDDDDEEEDDLDPDGPPSPPGSPTGTLKSRPTTLNLTTAVSQDSLNNNSLSPKKGSWQDSIRNPVQQGRLSPNHSCLDDGIHVTGQCPAAPVSQAPGSQSKDVTRALSQTSRVPSVDENSQCSDTEVDRDLINDHNHKHLNRCTTDTYTVTSESGMEPETDPDPDATSRCLSSTAPIGGNDGADTPLSDEELDKDFEVEFMHKETYDLVCKENQRSSYVEFPCIEPLEATSFSSHVSTDQTDTLDGSNISTAVGAALDAGADNESTSPSSDPGIADMNTKQGYVTDQDQDLSSPASDSDVEGELEGAFACGGHLVSNMISSISETELDLTSDESSSGRSSHLTNSIEEASSPTSDQELDPDTELEQDSGIVGMKASLLLGQPDPIKVVGPRLMPCTDDYGTSEGDSESESEDELSENSDSPWLLSKPRQQDDI